MARSLKESGNGYESGSTLPVGFIRLLSNEHNGIDTIIPLHDNGEQPICSASGVLE